MTISPPAKVKIEDIKPLLILHSGFDSLDLAIDVNWQSDGFFELLEEWKAAAQEIKNEVPRYLLIEGKEKPVPFMVKPHGASGYEWLLESSEMDLKIGKSLSPMSRPSVFAELRSDALCRFGPEQAVDRLVCLLLSQGGSKIVLKPSRVDLYVDFLMTEEMWSIELLKDKVTRSRKYAPYFDGKLLTGISIGRGKLTARLYDKPLEIKQQSGKYYMYDVWGLDKVPSGYKIIRCEFQFRRESLVPLNIKTLENLFNHHESLWAYATQKWLKFQSPGSHHTQRKTLPWWQSIQDGFQGAQGATPAVRAKALKHEKGQLRKMVYGSLTSLSALHMEEMGLDLMHLPNMFNALEAVFIDSPELRESFLEDVLRKRVKYHRDQEKWEKSCQLRNELGLPVY